MSTTVDRAALVAALRGITRAIKGNPALPVLNNVAVTSEDGQLVLVTTDLQVFARRRVTFEGEPLPNLTVPAKSLLNFASGFSGEKVTLALDDKASKLRLTSGRQKASLSVIDYDNFPAFPVLGEGAKSFTLSLEEIADIAAFVTPFAATDQARPILTGVQVRGDGTTLRFAAADNYRVGIVNVDHQTKVEAVIPASSLAIVDKVLEGSDVTVTLDGRSARFDAETGTLSSRIIDGQYPELERVVPTAFAATAVVSTEEFGTAAKLAALAETVAVKFEEADDGLRIYANGDGTDYDTTLDALIGAREKDVEPVAFAIGTHYVGAIAAAFRDSTRVEVKCNGPLAPIGFHDPDNAAYQAIVMPVRTPGK